MSLNILMKLYNIKLQELDIARDLKSWQGPYILRQLPYLNLDYNICLIDLCQGSVHWEELNIIEIVTSINNSSIDIIFFLMADHRFENPLSDSNSNLYKVMSSITKPVIYITWDYINDKKIQHQIKYPLWATLCATYKKYINTTEYTYYSGVEITSTYKKYLYSSLSNIIYGFRLINVVEFQKSNYYNRSLILVNKHNKAKDDKYFWEWEMQLRWPMYASAFKQLLPTLPINTATSTNDIVLANGAVTEDVVFEYTNAAYTNSYVNVIVESMYEYAFFSEKTFKPMLASQFFVIIAGKGSVAALREMGFDTYDDIIDHSIYDNEDDDTRIQAVHKLLRYMQYYDWEQIYTNTVERRKKNRQLLVNLTFEKTFITKLTRMTKSIAKPT